MRLEEIDKQIAELQELRKKVEAEEAERTSQERFEEAVILYPELAATLRRLDELGYLPVRLADALRDSTGKVNVGLYIKRPRAPFKNAKPLLGNSSEASDVT